MKPLGAKVVGTPAPLRLEIEHDLVVSLRPAARRRGRSVPSLIRELLDMAVINPRLDTFLDECPPEEAPRLGRPPKVR
jgi:hypothetical protein